MPQGRVQRAGFAECRAYVNGAMRDSTFNRLHKSIKIAQADIHRLRVY